MTDIANPLRLHAGTVAPAAEHGLQLFADGCHEPDSRTGGWAFVACCDGVTLASDCGGVMNSTNNAMEVLALLRAVEWINGNAAEEPAVIWSDSIHAVRGCNSLRHIWKHNGWKKLNPNPKGRRRSIADAELWQAVDLQLSRNERVTVAWCKGHAGIGGNERADELANKGRLAMRLQAGRA